MDDKEHNSIFGTGNIGPDRIRMSMAGSLNTGLAGVGGGAQSDKGMLNNMGQFDQYEGEFHIVKGFTDI